MTRPWIAGLIGALLMLSPQSVGANKPPEAGDGDAASQPDSIGYERTPGARRKLETFEKWLKSPTLATAVSAQRCIAATRDGDSAPQSAIQISDEELADLRDGITNDVVAPAKALYSVRLGDEPVELPGLARQLEIVGNIEALLEKLAKQRPVDEQAANEMMRGLADLHRQLGAFAQIEDVLAAARAEVSELPGLGKREKSQVTRALEAQLTQTAGEKLAKATTAQRTTLETLWRREDAARVAKIDVEIIAQSSSVDALVERLQADALEQFQKDQGCSAADVLCLDENGQALDSGLPHVLAQGREITVKVISPVANVDSIRLTISETTRSSVTIEKQAPEEDKEGGADSCALVPAEEVGFKVAATESFTVPKSLAIVEVVVEFERTPKADDPVRARHRAWIDHGYYFVSVGLLFPFVPDGKQQVAARTIGTERYLALERDLHVTAGLAVNVFPGGRRRGELSPWSNLRCDPSIADAEKRECKKRGHRRRAAEFLGLQIGADLDVRDPFDQFYFGLVLEPVTGVTFSGGAAVLELDELGVGLSPGQLVASDADLVARQRYHVKPYFAFGLGLDLVAAIRAARDRAEQSKP